MTDSENLFQGWILKHLIEKAVIDARKNAAQGTDDLNTFFSMDFGQAISAKYVGPHLAKFGVSRRHLLDLELLKTLTPPEEISHGIVVDMMSFLKRERLPQRLSRNIVEILGTSVSDLTDKQLIKSLSEIVTTYQSNRKSINKPGGKEKVEQFLAEKLSFPSQVVPTPASSPTPTPAPTPTPQVPNETAVKLLSSLSSFVKDRNLIM